MLWSTASSESSPPFRQDAKNKVDIILGSLRVHRMGWLGLIPVAGLAIAPFVLYRHYQVSALAGREWNPARSYLRRGLFLALTSLCLHAVVFALLIHIISIHGRLF